MNRLRVRFLIAASSKSRCSDQFMYYILSSNARSLPVRLIRKTTRDLRQEGVSRLVELPYSGQRYPPCNQGPDGLVLTHKVTVLAVCRM